MQADTRKEFPARWRRFPFLVGFVFLATVPRPAPAAVDIVLDLPVRCDFKTTCSIQKYFDDDPGPGHVDYACGRLTNDGHRGTDFRVPDIPTMLRGIPVVAAAPGTVKAIRDSMPDISVKEIGRAALGGRDAGNGVVISHGNGWETQYSHLRRGSVAVEPGQRVKAGDVLGMIGMSGYAEFPHTHFSVRHNGKALDPFVGSGRFDKCTDTRHPLWSAAALRVLQYRPTGGLTAGFAPGKPDRKNALYGKYAREIMSRHARALVFWVELYGVMKGDVEQFRIEGPDGATIFQRKHPLKKSFIRWFSFSGQRRHGGAWAPGAYQGLYSLERNGKIIVTMRRSVVMR